MFELLDFLRSTPNSLDVLQDEYGISVKRHNKYNNLVLLKYHQLNSPKDSKMVQQCRGIILDENDNWRVICRSFDRFFNLGEGAAARLDFAEARVYEKLDGSLCQLYYYDGQWHVATSGTPDANGNVGDFNKNFKDLFWETWNNLGYKFPAATGACYCFELMTPYNAIVIQHQSSDIIMLGARELTTYKELNPIVVAHQNGWRCVKTFDFNGQTEIEELLKSMNGSDQEGFVVCDTSTCSRVKMKCADYVKKHRLVSSMSQRNMLDAVRTNESDEILIYAPQFERLYWNIRVRYENLLGEIQGYYDGVQHIDERKDFAALATQKKYSAGLFSMKFGQLTSFKEYLADMNIRQLEDWLKIKEINV